LVDSCSGRPFALFEKRSYSSEFSLSWKNASVNRLYKYLSERWLPAILTSLDGMLSKPATFFSFSLANSLRTTLTGGSLREKVVLVASR